MNWDSWANRLKRSNLTAIMRNDSGGIERAWAGVPRRLFKPGTNDWRCACVKSAGPPQDDSLSDTNEGDLRFERLWAHRIIMSSLSLWAVWASLELTIWAFLSYLQFEQFGIIELFGLCVSILTLIELNCRHPHLRPFDNCEPKANECATIKWSPKTRQNSQNLHLIFLLHTYKKSSTTRNVRLQSDTRERAFYNFQA